MKKIFNFKMFVVLSLIGILTINGMMFFCLVDPNFHKEVRRQWLIANIWGEFWNKPLERYLALRGVEPLLDFQEGKKVNVLDYDKKPTPLIKSEVTPEGFIKG